jgi:hypothetical protein
VKKKVKENKPNNEDAIGGSAPLPTALIFDYEEYAHHLKDADLTEDQKHKFLEIMWNINVSFVDLGWGIHSLQQSGGQEHPIEKLQTLDSGDVVTSDHSSLKNFTRIPEGPFSPPEKRSHT